MLRTILIYGAILAVAAFGLQFLEYRVLAWSRPVELWLVLLAIGFMGLGVWVGARLFRRQPAPAGFVANTTVQKTLGISEREIEVLHLLASGESNKGIANKLNVSPNTVKTHVASLYGKLEVRRRTEAVMRARELGIIR